MLDSKKGKWIALIIGVVAVALALGVAIVLLLNRDTEAYRTISISEIVGTAKATHEGKEYAAYKDMKLQDGYALKTDSASHVRMLLDESKYIKLEENSKVVFEELGKEGSGHTSILLEYGAVTNEVAKSLQDDEEYSVNTTNAVLGVRGTFFRVELKEDADGKIRTNVYTYGGAVKVQRVLPNGDMVEENVLVDAGYKTTICMDGKDTIYEVEEGNDSTEPIKLEDIPDGDLVDMYVASVNGHEMFLDLNEIWDEIEERDINVEDYTSNRDGQAIVPPENDDSQGGSAVSIQKPELTTELDIEEAKKWFYVLDSCYDENGEIIIHADLTRYEEKNIPAAEFDINKYIEMYKAHGYSYDGDESDLLALNTDVLNKHRTVYYKLVLTEPYFIEEIAYSVVEGLIESGQKKPPTEDEMDDFNNYVESIRNRTKEYLTVGMQISYIPTKNTYSVWLYGELRFDGTEFIRFTENGDWCPRLLEYNAEDRIWQLEQY